MAGGASWIERLRFVGDEIVIFVFGIVESGFELAV